MNQRLARLFAPAIVAAMSAFLAHGGARACTWSRIDHEVREDTSGPWKPKAYRALVDVATVAQVGGALWEGAESRFGRLLWQGVESELIGMGSSEGLKHVFTRVRPRDADDPCLFFQGGSHRSFPSSEAALAAALVTPYLLEYAGERPATYGLLLLPLYVGVGRVKAHAHWQSDVLAGWTVGGLAGWYEHGRDPPLLVRVAPGGVVLGLRARF